MTAVTLAKASFVDVTLQENISEDFIKSIEDLDEDVVLHMNIECGSDDPFQDVEGRGSPRQGVKGQGSDNLLQEVEGDDIYKPPSKEFKGLDDESDFEDDVEFVNIDPSAIDPYSKMAFEYDDKSEKVFYCL